MNRQYEVGNVYGSLKVTQTFRKDGRSWAVCNCLACGNTIVTRMDLLKAGRVTSCGCRLKRMWEVNRYLNNKWGDFFAEPNQPRFQHNRGTARAERNSDSNECGLDGKNCARV